MPLMNSRHQPKRWLASLVSGAMLLQIVTPAFAEVSQIPGIFIPPPNPNVFFTLDDSGSMQADALPDYNLSGVSYTSVPTATDSTFFGGSGGRGVSFPNMWGPGSDYLSITYYGGLGNTTQDAVTRYMRSSSGNPLYYSPEITYLPWVDPTNDSVRLANANPAAVRINYGDGRPTATATNTIDLTVRQGTGSNRFWYGTYFVYNNESTAPLPLATPHTTLNTASAFTRREITNSTTSTFPRHPNRTDCTGAVLPATNGCTQAQELQNFANWLQYYRNRMLMAKGGVSAAFAQQSANLRVGLGAINQSGTLIRGVSTFSGSSRTNFYSSLFGRSASTITPLRRAMDDVGKYFQGQVSAFGNPWAEDTANRPGQADSCRKSFHILSTDGFWNDAAATSPASSNNDRFASSGGTAETTPAPPGQPGGYPYTDTGSPGTLAARFTINPFRDGDSNTLADVAAYYWKTDLQGGANSSNTLENSVSPSTRDPAFWQHLSTYTVGLGITGSGQTRPADAALSARNSLNEWVVAPTLPSSSVFYNFRNKPWLSDPDLRDLLVAQRTPMAWPTPSGDSPSTGDDLVHAAINGRGRYFSATNPQALATGIAAALAEATNQNSSLANLSVATTSETSTDNKLFQAVYNPSGWTGRLYAFPLNGGAISTDPANALWEASRVMPSPSTRNIFTWDPLATTTRGTPFTWAGLNSNQQAALGPVIGVGSTAAERLAVLEYLRGSPSREAQNGGPLRDRVRENAAAGVLGDIVGGSPLKGPEAGGGYQRMRPTSPGRDTYDGAAGFRTADPAASRIGNMINSLYFGANDGMLHTVAADTGIERFAYVPNSVFSVPRTTYKGTTSTVKKLYEMSRPDYAHLFTVNGPPQVADAFVGTSAGAGDWKAVLLGSTGAGARSVFAMDITNPAVGSGTGQFGVNSLLWEFSEEDDIDMGHMPSYPHVAKMQDGTWVAMFGNGYDSGNGRAVLYLRDVQTGDVVWKQAVGTPGANGLSQPNFLLNSFREVVAIWAGDLQGNMWKFDVNSANRADWHVAFGGSPLFTTRARQPITVMPEIERFPGTNNAMVIFGTGKQFDLQDSSADPAVNANLTQQAIYGIWDNEIAPVSGFGQLLQRGFDGTSRPGFERTTTDDVTPIDWAVRRGWELPLPRTGERVNVNPLIAGQHVFVVANTPSNEPCSSGGLARVLALNPITGLSPRFSVLDSNNDDRIDSNDARFNVLTVSAGVLSLPRFLRGSGAPGVVAESPYSRGQTGAMEGGVEFKDSSSTSCAGGSMGRLVGGISNVNIINERVKLAECKGRVSWRQIQ